MLNATDDETDGSYEDDLELVNKQKADLADNQQSVSAVFPF